MNRFWMVWSPSGDPPTYQHKTMGSAETEACRLARLHCGKEFYILAAEKMIVKRDLDIVELREQEREIPF